MQGDLLVKKLSARDRLSDAERRRIAELVSTTKEFPKGEDIVRDGSRPGYSTLVADGFCCRYKLMPDGTRQISAIHIAGDFVDLHSYLLKKMDHGVAAITPCRVALVPHERLAKLTEEAPHLTRLMWLSTLIDASIHREWITSLGRRSAVGRVAHLFCELFLRLQVVNLTDGMSCRLPLTQQELADALGLSLVHTNRSLRTLRTEELIRMTGDTLVIEDWDGLQNTAEFDPAYLHLEPEPR